MILGIAYDEDLANVVDDLRARSGGCPFGAQTPVVSR
jgi:hypothetical protein